jgi:4-hydroxybenzoyl-CoA thioesterase
MTLFRARRIVRFSQCAPAGIIFCPRYLQIVHEIGEDWFREVLDLPYSELTINRKRGFPMRKLEADDLAPSRLGDCLDIELAVSHVGTTSLHIASDIRCAGDPRALIKTIGVQTDIGTGSPTAIVGKLRTNIENFKGVLE